MFKDIKEYVKEEKAKIQKAIESRGYHPRLLIMQVGDNEASNRYVRNKMRDCSEVGIFAETRKFPDVFNFSYLGLTSSILKEQDDHDALMVQLPLPGYDPAQVDYVLNSIDPEKDVDGLGKRTDLVPCTARGIMDYLDYCDYDFSGKHVVVIGRSDLVGRPLAKLLIDRDATVTLCHSKTKNLFDFLSSADLIVCAVGKANFLNCYPIHCPVVDVGTNFVNGKLVGDCFNTENREVTPVPGGVGLLTRLSLLKNICDVAGIKYE